MRWFSDRTGFPVLELPAVRLAVHLLPVAKPQFERFLSDPGPYGDAWYEEILAVSPRIALTDPEPDPFESFFLSGIQPTEIAPFAKWLGVASSFRPPMPGAPWIAPSRTKRCQQANWTRFGMM